MVIVGNKCELEMQRAISYEEAQALALETDAPYYEISCKENLNVDSTFSETA